ncbi:Uncharacterised protein [Neisseria meningitidis]|nr:Uncharacterised protein [Neisseria meningitidis]
MAETGRTRQHYRNAKTAQLRKPYSAQTVRTRRLYRRHSERQSENRNRKAVQTARVCLSETAPSSEKHQLESGAACLRQMGLQTGGLNRSRCGDYRTGRYRGHLRRRNRSRIGIKRCGRRRNRCSIRLFGQPGFRIVHQQQRRCRQNPERAGQKQHGEKSGGCRRYRRRSRQNRRFGTEQCQR